MREGRRIEVLCLAQDHVAQLPSQDILGIRHPSPDVCCLLPPRGGMAGSRFPLGSQASPGISTIRWFSCPIALASCWIDRTVCLSQEAYRIRAEMLTPGSSARAAPFPPRNFTKSLHAVPSFLYLKVFLPDRQQTLSVPALSLRGWAGVFLSKVCLVSLWM